MRVKSAEQWREGWLKFGPYLVALILLGLGYRHYAPGAAYSLNADAYRAWAFPAFRYSDIIWMYLRDHLAQHPLPYIDYPLEYPPLTGLLTWLVSWTPDLPTYFTTIYLLLGIAALSTIWALQRLNGANVWLFALSPGLFFYAGHQLDLVAIAAATLALLSWQRGRPGWGVCGLIVATSLKLFPIVFLVSIVVEQLRDRRIRAAAFTCSAFALGSVAINAPVALANYSGWSFFFTWNRDRLADSGIWVLWRDAGTSDLTRWSMVAAIVGGICLTILALRARGPIAIPLGATYLLWWLLVNKTFTTHLMLWVVLCLALLAAPWWLWGLVTAMDLVGFQLGNYLNLYNIPDYRHAPLIRKAVENVYDPVQLARSAVLLIATIFGITTLRSNRLRKSHAPLSAAHRPLWPFLRSDSAKHPHALASLRPHFGFAVCAALILTLAAIVMTWPYAAHASTSTIAGFDPLLQIWLSEWIQHSLVTNPLALYNGNIFYPLAQTLAYTDANIPGALVAAPINFLTQDPVLTNTLLVLASFVVAGLGVFTLILWLTNNRAAALIAGLAYAFLPFRMVHLWHLNWLEGALLPWVLFALLLLLERPTVARGLALGVLAGALLLVSFYFSVQLIIVSAAVLIAWAISQWQLPQRDSVRSLAIAVVTAALIAVPFFLPYLQVRNEQLLERSIVDAEQYKALPESYLQLPPWDAPNAFQRAIGLRAGLNESLSEVGQERHADGHVHAEFVIEDALFPGLVASIFAVVALLLERRRRWLLAALAATVLLAVLLSLGPTLGLRQGNGFGLPYGWLFDNVPLFRSMRVPARLGGLADLAVVILGGLGIAAIWPYIRRRASSTRTRWLGPALTALAVLFLIVDLWTGPVPIEAIDRSPAAMAAANWLATQPPGAVMEFPAESIFADPAAASVRRHYGEQMFRSTRNWLPMVNGNSGFIPRAYSDFIERFVGELPRPDGTLTPRISHLEPETVRLLSQICVRYVVVHANQYRAADWPAVEASLDQLSDEGLLSSSGWFGQSEIFVINPVVPAIQPPRVSLFAPSLLISGGAWAPWIGIESPSGAPAVLALARPAVLETTWYDASGRELHHSQARLPLPAVMDDAQLLCSTSECLTSRPFLDLRHFPAPDSNSAWTPQEPGHYVVRFTVKGDQELACDVDLDLVADSAAARDRSGDDPFRWAACTASSSNPVNNPGAVPFKLGSPSITFVGDVISADISISPRVDSEVRGWFILAPLGVTDPWNHAVFRSTAQQRLIAAGERTPFTWQVATPSDLPAGVYALSFWFHERAPSGWRHAVGGDLGLAPVVVDDQGSIRWAGPIRGTIGEVPPVLTAGQTSTATIAISGTTGEVACQADWQLFAGARPVASGNAQDCTSPVVAIPSAVQAGQYRLQITLSAQQDGARAISDAVAAPVVVISAPASGPS